MSAPRGAAEKAYCVLVSSCDAYEDCWLPFFTLFAEFWQPPTPVIYLNTETRAFSLPGLDIRCPAVEVETGRKLGWSGRLRRCLDQIPFEVVLYLQEDYFLEAPVDVAMVESLVELMRGDRVGHVSLVPGRRSGTASEHPLLSRIDREAEFRLSAQAGLWKTQTLRSYLRPHETVWELEWYGTRRARRRRDIFYYVNHEYERLYGQRVVQYQGTGIVHGRWVREIVEELFADHDIEVDYSARGFFDAENDMWKQRPRVVRAARRLRSIW